MRAWAPWLSPLPDAARMRATDAWAIEARGVPSLDLMERAGEGLARVTAEVAPDGPVAIVCGGGNNGGDGLVAARLLRDAGREGADLTGDPAANLARLPGPSPRPFTSGALDGARVVVDALLGTGTTGPPREATARVIEAMNAAAAPVVAADVPSGVDASTGATPGTAVRAVATATFHLAKPGLHVAPGKAHAGALHVIDIAMPPEAPEETETGLIEPVVLDGIPRRGADATKFSSGTVVVIGGSAGMTGAPAMAALATQRAGAGYVVVATPASVQLVLQVKLLEAMTRGLPEADGALAGQSLAPALEALARAGAAVLGPGLGRAEATQGFARDLALAAELPLLLDADGLNAFAGAGGLERLAERSAPTVLTPHAGELGRLLGRPSAEIEAARLDSVREAARRARAVVVLKGDDTLVALPDGRVAVAPGGAPGLATAGTGDVLSGVIGALLAKGLPAEHAACAGVLAHQRAGRLAAEPHGPDSVIAGDVIAALPAALARRR